MRSRATWSMTESKRALRRRIRKEAVAADGSEIARKIMEHPWFLKAHTVMAYMAIPPEPDISSVLEAALASGKILLLPRCEKDGTMTPRVVRSLSDLQSGAFGIMEPSVDSKLYSPEAIDLILVPGLAFDRSCRRLGRGKGYYDRFISGQRTMGVCGCLLPEVPVEEHDKPMDAVITENEILYGLEETHV